MYTNEDTSWTKGGDLLSLKLTNEEISLQVSLFLVGFNISQKNNKEVK